VLALLQETGNDPITGEATTLEDLLPVKTNKAVKPRPSPATSIPGLLGLFHNVRPPATSPFLMQSPAAGKSMQSSCKEDTMRACMQEAAPWPGGWVALGQHMHWLHVQAYHVGNTLNAEP
jgi:hypothetical protein